MAEFPRRVSFSSTMWNIHCWLSGSFNRKVLWQIQNWLSFDLILFSLKLEQLGAAYFKLRKLHWHKIIKTKKESDTAVSQYSTLDSGALLARLKHEIRLGWGNPCFQMWKKIKFCNSCKSQNTSKEQKILQWRNDLC